MVSKQKEGWRLLANHLISLVRPAGFEPAAYGFEALISGTVGISRETQGFNYFK